MGEKGHVKPANYLDSHEKFLIGVATKGGNAFMFVTRDLCHKGTGFIRLFCLRYNNANLVHIYHVRCWSFSGQVVQCCKFSMKI